MPSGLDEDADVEDGPILDPDELDISKDERVKEIDDGRYVVSSGGPVGGQQNNELESGQQDRPAMEAPSGSETNDTGAQPMPPADEQGQSPDHGRRGQGQPQHGRGGQASENSQPHRQPSTSDTEQSLDARSVHNWLSEDLQASNSQYAFDITANFEGSVSQQRMVSNDVVTTFESLVMWYAQQTDRSTPVGEILGLLLMESNVPVRYPPKAVRRALSSTNLSADDTIADLLEEISRTNGLQM